MRFVVPLAVAALALTGCGGGQVETPAQAVEVTDERREEVYVALMQDSGIVPTYGDADEALVLARQICDRYDRGDDFVDIITTMVGNGIEGSDAGKIIGTATAVFCPEHEMP